MKDLIKKSNTLSPIVRIGKSGLSDGIVGEIINQLKLHKLIKIKFLRAYLEGKDKKEEAQNLASKTKSTLVHQVGFTVVLHKR